MIVIEANEIPKEVFEWYAKNSNGILSKTINSFGIVKTLLDDEEEEFLYPSQAWASISTGLPASTHKIRWYNDAKEDTKFYWRELVKKNKSVGLMNVLHTGSISNKESLKYDFIFPDFFSLKPEVNIKQYRNFQIFNHNMSVSSGRKTSKKTLLLNAIKSFIRRPIPSSWGISFIDFSKWINIILSIKNDSEVLRNAQFILQQRIFLNINKQNLGNDLLVFFTNHVASCLHRNFHDLNDYSENKDKKEKIYQSMGIFDDFLKELRKINPNREIVIISAMGQKLNTKVDENYKLNNSTDYKLTNHFKFLKFFGINEKKVEVLFEMVPQYTFKFLSSEELDKFIKNLNNVGSDPNAMRFGYYVPTGDKSNNALGFFCHLDRKDNQVTCTMTVRPNEKGIISLNNNSYHFQDLGFTSLSVSDYHHGEHSKYGCMITFQEKIQKKEIHFTEIKKYIISQV